MFRSWFIHNLVGHPLMAICFLFGFNNAGKKIHNATLPKSAFEGITNEKH